MEVGGGVYYCHYPVSEEYVLALSWMEVWWGSRTGLYLVAKRGKLVESRTPVFKPLGNHFWNSVILVRKRYIHVDIKGIF
jgi:hypothetical protein